MPLHIFREYDIRGVADRDLTDSVVERLGMALAARLPRAQSSRPRPLIAVARDCRLSGERIFSALTRGLTRGGVDVVNVGVGPTPMMYFAAHHLDTDGGVMITGSHNPPGDNGFKLVQGTASFFGEQIQEVGRLVMSGDLLPAQQPGTVTERDVQAAYVDALTSGIRIGNRGLKFVIDAGNGAAGPLGLAAMKRVGLEPVALYCDMDGTFPNHHPDPTVVENLAALVQRVREEGAVVGLAWDGDGDRLGVVDKDGSAIWGDRLLALFARRILAKNPGAAVIADVKCSQTLFDDVNAHGGRGIMWKTGHSLIKSKMKQEHAAVAGEMSGHFFFKDRYLGYDDGIYAALRVAEILAEEGSSIGELIADIPHRESTPELRLSCPDEHKFEVVAKVQAHFRGKEKVNELDGARIQYADGSWALVRASNTGPVIVTRFEAPTAARLEQIRAEVEQVVRRVQQETAAS